MRLNRLYLNGFRGATGPVTINFDADKPITMIFAENGNGKSTISDAFCCLLSNEIGSIGDKSGVDRKHLNSIQGNEARIILTTSANTYSATVSANGRNIAKSPSTGLPSFRSLRRRQIVNLIEAQPSDRYNELKDFLDVAEVFKCETELRRLVSNTENNLENIVSIISQANETLEKAWNEERNPESDFMSWARIQSAKDVSTLEEDSKKYLALKELWENVISRYQDYGLGKVNFETIEAQLKLKEEELETAKTENENGNVELLQLLEKAKNYIDNDSELNICPVCENSVERQDVVNALANKISAMNLLKIASDAYIQAKRVFDGAKASLDSDINSLHSQLQKYHDVIKAYSESETDLQTFVDSFSENAVSNLELFESNKLSLENFAKQVSSIAETKSRELNQYNLIKTQFLAINVNTEKAEKLQKLSEALTETLEIVESSRKQFTDQVLSEISADIDAMYSALHPGENIGNIKMFLKPTVQSSLMLQGNFHGITDVAPQSLYSESHLDTLGICIFLALAKKYGDTNTILVLDDVVMSVDEKHLDRFIELLHSVADSFGQIIMTTHYRPWRDRYRNNRAPNGNVHFLELRNWSLENGIRVQNGKMALDELKEMVENDDNFHRENISSSAGRILENILDFLSLKFRCKLPRNPKNEYTLADLLNGFSSTLLPLLKVEHFTKDANNRYTILDKTVELRGIINELKQLNAVRNQVGAHYNFDGSLVSDDDVLQFGKKTIEFAELLICPENGNLPTENRSGSYWETKKKSIKLYPLQTP